VSRDRYVTSRDGPAPVSSALTRRIRSSRTSVRSAGELESVKNFYSLSAPTSLSSVHQPLNDDWPSWSDWNDREILG